MEQELKRMYGRLAAAFFGGYLLTVGGEMAHVEGVMVFGAVLTLLSIPYGIHVWKVRAVHIDELRRERTRQAERDRVARLRSNSPA